MSEHTRGPWENQGEFVFAGSMNGKLIATVHDCMGVNRTAAEMAREISVKEANANNLLICAAPDLLAALKLTVKELKAWQRDHGNDIATQEAIAHANAAIRKAEGK